MTEVSALSAARAQILRDDARQLREDERSERVDERREDDRSQRIAQRLETEQTEQFQREFDLRRARERIAAAQPNEDLPRGSIVDIIG